MKDDKKTISFSLPYPTFVDTISEGVNQIKKDLTSILQSVDHTFRTFTPRSESAIKKMRFSLPKLPDFKSKKKMFRYILPVVLVAVLLVSARTIVETATKGSNNSNQDLTLEKPTSSTSLNKGFTFPLKDEDNKEVGSFKYTVTSADLNEQIIVQGKRATAVEGRTFLIVNIKIVNSLKSGLSINSRDYIRLSVNGNKNEWLAPDIHNDPVEAQAESTKYTRVGFAINDADTDLTLRVGEIDGKKELIKLDFKK